MAMEGKRTVLEFYSGIGGMHYALKQSNVKFYVLAAFDINTTANHVYRHNHPTTPLLQKNIEGFTVEYLDQFAADIWTMSPPCQPYTRQGKQEESNDPRAKSFLNILKILKVMENPPNFIFIENVKGFECSDTHDLLVATLKLKNFEVQEFLVSPHEFGVPNSRTRYYLIGRYKSSFKFQCTSEPISDIFNVASDDNNETSECGDNEDTSQITSCLRKELKEICRQCRSYQLAKFLDCEPVDEYLLGNDVLLRYHSILDIRHPDSARSCCFTKGYGKYVEGTGSVLTPLSEHELKEVYEKVSQCEDNEEKSNLLGSLKLRYFTPREVANLMCFPTDFTFPEDTTRKQKYRLLGNSVNVFVISCLMKWYLFNDIDK